MLNSEKRLNGMPKSIWRNSSKLNLYFVSFSEYWKPASSIESLRPVFGFAFSLRTESSLNDWLLDELSFNVELVEFSNKRWSFVDIDASLELDSVLFFNDPIELEEFIEIGEGDVEDGDDDDDADELSEDFFLVKESILFFLIYLAFFKSIFHLNNLKWFKVLTFLLVGIEIVEVLDEFFLLSCFLGLIFVFRSNSQLTKSIESKNPEQCCKPLQLLESISVRNMSGINEINEIIVFDRFETGFNWNKHFFCNRISYKINELYKNNKKLFIQSNLL